VSRIGDCIHDTPWYARKATLPVRNAAYRATRPLRTLTGTVRNARNRRFVTTGKGFALERATRRLRSSLPFYRDRINTGTGRPRRDDMEIYGRRDEGFARMRQQGLFSARSPLRGDDVWRDHQAVRDTLARSQDAGRARIAAHADAVLGPGRAARAAEAMRQAQHDPWADPHRPGRSR
jgi:hypothetical protein